MSEVTLIDSGLDFERNVLFLNGENAFADVSDHMVLFAFSKDC